MKKRFIFDENYIKKYAKKDKIKWLVIGISALVLILIVIIVIMANRGKKDPVKPITPVFELKEELYIESGSTIPEAVDFFKTLENIDIDDIKVIYPEDFEISYDTSLCSEEEIEELDKNEDYDSHECVTKTLRTPSTYGITLIVLDKEYTVNLIIQDTQAPVISAKNLEIYYGNTYQVNDFIQFCVDASSECQVAFYDKDVDDNGNVIDYAQYTNPGTYQIRIYAKDKFDNVSEPVTVSLTIVEVESALYIVTFDSNGGSTVGSIKAPDGTAIVEPENPTRDGYQFVGWYLGNTKFDFNSLIDRNITLVAKWEKNGGGGGQTGPGTITVSSVSLDFKKINLTVGESKTVKASVYPANATNKTVTWSSKDTSIATVSNGKITGVKAGTTTITATAGGKSASVEVVVRETGGSTCTYGDANYNSQFILSVNLIQNNCAVDPNRTYNQVSTVVSKDHQRTVQVLTGMGLSVQNNYFEHKEVYANIKNTSGTGLVGVQITVTINVIDPDNPYVYMTASYIIKPDGSRQFIKNNITKNGINFS